MIDDFNESNIILGKWITERLKVAPCFYLAAASSAPTGLDIKNLKIPLKFLSNIIIV